MNARWLIAGTPWLLTLSAMACTVGSLATHPASSCESSADCAGGEACYLGFCVAGEDAPPAQIGDGGTPAGDDPPDGSTPPGDASATTDGAVSCDRPRTPCEAQCVDLQTSSDHCGECGNACAVDGLCCEGSCVARDETNCNGCGVECDGTTCCDSGCTDLSTDRDNCGACGTACAAGQYCSEGVCCGTGLTNCDGQCLNLDTDRAHCGSCENSCSGLESCRMGQCCSGVVCQ